MATVVWTSPRGKPEAYVELITTAQQAEPAQAKTLTTDDVVESPTAPNPGQSLTIELTTINNILVADVQNDRPGYVNRFVWVNAASTRIGTTFAGVQVEAAPAAWLTEADVPPGNTFNWVMYGAAAGSGSGCANRGSSGTASFNGGGPSGGGARHEWECSRQDILDSLPVFFDVPLGGLGGDRVVSTTNLLTVNGNPGLAPLSTCSITGTKLSHMAGGGFPGLGGNSGTTGAAGSGGGELGNAISSAQGGAPYDLGPTVGSIAWQLCGGGRSNTRNTTGASGVSYWCKNGGSGGGSNGNGSTIIHGARSKYGACGGGHGGRYTLASAQAIQASDGGNHDTSLTGAPWGGGGGLAGSAPGESGQDGPDGSYHEGGQGGGGGMASNGVAGNNQGGDGGEGGFPGGGSGGGGASYSPIGQNSTSGAGRKGADAAIILTIKL